MLKGKKIILGVTGSIAAYKAALVVRLLVKQGALVKVVMTPAATAFITPLTLSTLSKNDVLIKPVANSDTGKWNNHVELGLWADLFLIAPATANTLSKMVSGQADNLLLTTYLSARCPVMIAPAMDVDMFHHKATQNNIALLRKRGHTVLPSDTGELASGLTGEGRMLEPETLLEQVQLFFAESQPLRNQKWLITAGPTYEAIDPVRFIGNHSSGKMGLAIAEEAAKKGADVVLVAGPGTPDTEHPGITRINITSAAEMYDACIDNFHKCTVAVLAAAVADFSPAEVAGQKIKKKMEEMTVRLKKTTDILKHLGSIKTKKQKLVGFALETENEVENALGKLKSKNLDLIVLNSLRDKGAGFGHATNKITLIQNQNNITEFELKPKLEVAVDIVEAIIKLN